MSVIWNTCGLCGTVIHRESGYDWLDQSRSTIGEDPVAHVHDPFGPWKNSDEGRPELLALAINGSHDRHEGRREFLALLDNVESGGYGDGTGTYDERLGRDAEGFMVAGNGPTAWVWFVFTDEHEIDHAYLELYTGGQGPQLIPIPPHLADGTLKALREDGVQRRRRSH